MKLSALLCKPRMDNTLTIQAPSEGPRLSGPEQFAASHGLALGAARRRFRALAILEAVGKASAAERNKLDRYQALLREKPSREMVSLWARQDWEHRCLMKMAGCVFRAAQRPNGELAHPAPLSGANSEGENK